MVTGDDNDDDGDGGDALYATNSTKQKAIEGGEVSRRCAFSPRTRMGGRRRPVRLDGDELDGEARMTGCGKS